MIENVIEEKREFLDDIRAGRRREPKRGTPWAEFGLGHPPVLILNFPIIREEKEVAGLLPCP